jgi:hypothetical protein
MALALLAASREQRLEGLIAKRLGSKYAPGKRTRDWIKVKNFNEREMVIGGWLAHRDYTFGILVGDRNGDAIVSGGVVDIGIGPNLIAVLETIEGERELTFWWTSAERRAALSAAAGVRGSLPRWLGGAAPRDAARGARHGRVDRRRRCREMRAAALVSSIGRGG